MLSFFHGKEVGLPMEKIIMLVLGCAVAIAKELIEDD